MVGVEHEDELVHRRQVGTARLCNPLVDGVDLVGNVQQALVLARLVALRLAMDVGVKVKSERLWSSSSALLARRVSSTWPERALARK